MTVKKKNVVLLLGTLAATNLFTYISSTGNTPLTHLLTDRDMTPAAGYDSMDETEMEDAMELSTDETGNKADESYYQIAACRTALSAEQKGYYYENLSEVERTLYIELLDAIINFRKDIEVSATDRVIIARVFQGVLSDHPEIFYLSGYTYQHQYGSDKLLFSGTYTMSKDDAIRMKAKLEERADRYLENIPQSSDYEKVKYIYESIILNTEYSVDAEDNQNIQSVLLNGKSVCHGYAKTMKYLLDKAGIETIMVYGTVSSGNRHAWNIVRIDGEWYHVDATWGDSAFQNLYQDTDQEFVNYDYLCTTTEDILKTHSIDMIVEIPECSSTKANYYRMEGAYFTLLDLMQLEVLFENAYERGQETVTIKADSSDTYNAMFDYLINQKQVFIYLQNKTTISYTVNEEQRNIIIWI